MNLAHRFIRAIKAEIYWVFPELWCLAARGHQYNFSFAAEKDLCMRCGRERP